MHEMPENVHINRAVFFCFVQIFHFFRIFRFAEIILFVRIFLFIQIFHFVRKFSFCFTENKFGFCRKWKLESFFSLFISVHFHIYISDCGSIFMNIFFLHLVPLKSFLFSFFLSHSFNHSLNHTHFANLSIPFINCWRSTMVAFGKFSFNVVGHSRFCACACVLILSLSKILSFSLIAFN